MPKYSMEIQMPALEPIVSADPWDKTKSQKAVDRTQQLLGCLESWNKLGVTGVETMFEAADPRTLHHPALTPIGTLYDPDQ